MIIKQLWTQVSRTLDKIKSSHSETLKDGGTSHIYSKKLRLILVKKHFNSGFRQCNKKSNKSNDLQTLGLF